MQLRRKTGAPPCIQAHAPRRGYELRDPCRLSGAWIGPQRHWSGDHADLANRNAQGFGKLMG